jgi:predicted amidophosphoribosyltransferase
MTRPTALRSPGGCFHDVADVADGGVSCGGRCPLGRGGSCSACVAGIPADRVDAGSLASPVWALGSYAGEAGRLVRALKYANVRAPVGALGSALAALASLASLASQASQTDQAAEPGPGADYDVVTWVPTTVGRRAQRGFDQAELLARSTARGLGVRSRRLLLRAPGPGQTSLPGQERRSGPVLRARRVPVGARILLVDDVVTTGTSLATASDALLAAGARSVRSVVVAATPAPGWRPDGGGRAHR